MLRLKNENWNFSGGEMDKISHKYKTFFLMIITSMIIMYSITYFNSIEVNHDHFSETRLYMNFMMGAAMATIMLSFMKSMYKNETFNRLIYVGSIIFFAVSLWLMRSQYTVEDQSYMRAMIPHHSIAILTSTRANITDKRVKKLADGIAKTQVKEIKEMKWLIEDIKKNGKATTDEEASNRQVPYL